MGWPGAGTVGVRDIEGAVRGLGLAGRPIEVHVSLRSFGGLEGGPASIVDGVVAAGSTVLAATMAPDLYGLPAPAHDRPARNGIDYARQDMTPPSTVGRVYEAGSTEVSAWLGAFSAHI